MCIEWQINTFTVSLCTLPVVVNVTLNSSLECVRSLYLKLSTHDIKTKTFSYRHLYVWSPHVQAICSKARRVLGLLYRKFYGCSNSDTLIQLYISIVRPHLEYACPVWAPHMAKDIHAVESVQKFACRMATRNWKSGYHNVLSLTELPTPPPPPPPPKNPPWTYMKAAGAKSGATFQNSSQSKDIVKLREQTSILSTTRSLHPLYLYQPRAHTNSYFYSFVPHVFSMEFSSLRNS